MQLLHPLSTDSACQLLKLEHYKDFVGIKKKKVMNSICIFHYPGQFTILEYYFCNRNTKFTKGEHIPLAFLQMHKLQLPP